MRPKREREGRLSIGCTPAGLALARSGEQGLRCSSGIYLIDVEHQAFRSIIFQLLRHAAFPPEASLSSKDTECRSSWQNNHEVQINKPNLPEVLLP